MSTTSKAGREVHQVHTEWRNHLAWTEELLASQWRSPEAHAPLIRPADASTQTGDHEHGLEGWPRGSPPSTSPMEELLGRMEELLGECPFLLCVLQNI